MVKGVLIDVVGQGLLDPILAHIVDTLAICIRSRDTLMKSISASTYFDVPVLAFARQQDDRIVKIVCFKNALEHQLSILSVMPISPS